MQLSVELIYWLQLPQKNRTWKTSSYNGDDIVWARSPKIREAAKQGSGRAQPKVICYNSHKTKSPASFCSDPMVSNRIRINSIRSVPFGSVRFGCDPSAKTRPASSRLQLNEQPLLLFYYYLQNARTLYHLRVRVCSHSSRRRCRSRVVAVLVLVKESGTVGGISRSGDS